MKIESVQNEKVKNWCKLHQKKHRDETKLFIVEEEHLIIEALKKGIVETLIINEGNINIFDFDNVVFVSGNVMKKLSTNISNVKYLAICNKIEEKFNLSNRILILDQIQDPSNMGSLIRSALSFGFKQIIMSDNCADIYNDKTIRATQGALFHVSIIKDDLKKKIKYLKENGYKVFALTLDNSMFLNDLPVYEKMVFVLGNEGNGIIKDIQDICDNKVKIEMNEFESLNVAIAGSIAMYNFRNI